MSKDTLLKYIWIEEYGCFKNAEFQFDRNFHFNYKGNKLTVFPKETTLSDDFWGESRRIDNIYAIVGDNGRGKTTFLRAIIDIFTQLYPCEAITENRFKDSAWKIKAIVVVSHGAGKYIILNMGASKLKVELGITDDKEIMFDYVIFNEKMKCRELLYDVKLAFFSNVFDYRDYSENKAEHISDYSLGGLLKNDFRRKNADERMSVQNNQVTEHHFHEIYRQISFMTEFYEQVLEKSQQKQMFSSWPKALNLRFHPREKSSDDVAGIRFCGYFRDVIFSFANEDENQYIKEQQYVKKSIDGELYKKIIERITPIFQDREKTIELEYDKIKYRLCRETFKNLLMVGDYESFYIINKTISQGELRPLIKAVEITAKEYIDRFQRDNNFHKDYLCIYKSLVRNLKEIKFSGSVHIKEIALYYSDMFECIFNMSSNLFSCDDFLRNGSFKYIIVDRGDHEEFNNFFNCYKKIVLPFAFLNFDWGMSSGESNLLSLYSRLFVMRKNIDGTNYHEKTISNYIRKFSSIDYEEYTCKTLWLLIDEADLTYHPRWQKELVGNLVEFLPLILEDAQLIIQVIFTTHSPILLGDMPGENVIYLTADKEGNVFVESNHNKSTFGQNIYLLFQDSFFMESPMGEFSSGKLNEIVKKIMGYKSRIDKGLKKGVIAEEATEIYSILQDIRKQVQVFGDRVIYNKLVELIDICEYKILPYVNISNDIRNKG